MNIPASSDSLVLYCTYPVIPCLNTTFNERIHKTFSKLPELQLSALSKSNFCQKSSLIIKRDMSSTVYAVDGIPQSIQAFVVTHARPSSSYPGASIYRIFGKRKPLVDLFNPYRRLRPPQYGEYGFHRPFQRPFQQRQIIYHKSRLD
jgi:hypothetical protein